MQPGNEKINNLIRLCQSQINYQTPVSDTTSNSPVKQTQPVIENSHVNTTRFDGPGWSFPGTNKDEFSIQSYEVNFRNTLTRKFIIYSADVFNVTISVTTIMDSPTSTVGLVIGYVSPSEYYLFKHKNGSDYVLQKIQGNEVENLLVIKNNKPEGGKDLLKIEYSNNLISIYNSNGLLNTYKSIWGIFGKAGIYVDKNTTAKFQNIFLSGSTSLN